ncbi:MAG: hypothetical protein WCF24_00535 [Acidimicrobiales bacterium]
MTEDPKPGWGRDSMKDSVRRYLEQRSPFSGMTRSELEQVVSEFLRGGDSKNRERVEDVIEEIRARSRRSVDRLTDLVRTEVRKEFESFSPGRREEIGEFFERFVGLLGEYFGSGRRSHDETAKKSPPAAKSVRKAVKKAVKKVPATKVAAKKAVAKADAAKKTTKAPAKRAAAKKTTSRRPSA